MKPVSLNQTRDEEVVILKEQGRQYLKTNQVGKALRIFSTILKEYPEDIDSMLIIGDSYLVAGEKGSALWFYQQAYRLAADRRDIKRRINLLQTADVVTDQPELNPTHPRAIADLIKKITGQPSQVPESDLMKAGQLLVEYLHSPSPAKAVADHLNEINQLLPALIELNIHQARLDGRIDIVDTLQEMLSNMLVQGDLGDITLSPSTKEKAETKKKPAILLSGVVSHEAPFRLMSIFQSLGEAGFEPVRLDRLDLNNPVAWNEFSLAIAHNPQADHVLLHAITAGGAVNLPVVVDLSADFPNLPDNHPDKKALGLDNPVLMENYQTALQKASLITVPGSQLAEELIFALDKVHIIPEGWNQYDLLWSRASQNHPFFNLGLNIIPGQLEDVLSIKRAVTRVVREYPHTRLVMMGDMDVYQMFDNLPDARKLFLPPVEAEDYPFLLSQMDLLMAPLRDDEFNRTRSDRRLMEAGVRRIPWVASAMPSYQEWGSGGLIASNLDEWYTHLQTFIQDRDLRQKYGQAGYQKALQRENQMLAKMWALILNPLIEKSTRGQNL